MGQNKEKCANTTSEEIWACKNHYKWQKYSSTCDEGRLGRVFRHIDTDEKQYCEGDGIISEVLDLIIINLNPGSSGSDSDCESDSQSDYDGSETDTDCCNIVPGEDSDRDLVQPL